MNSGFPLLSVITVVYNNLRGLQDTFQTIQSQTGTDFEWLVIDGGSTDGTVEWLKELNVPYLRFISEKDKGLYDAMNKGIGLASGKYLWFMNSGDGIYKPETIANLMAVSTDPDIFYGETMLINDNRQELGIRSEQTTRVLPETLTACSMINGMVVCHQSFIVKKTLAPFYHLGYTCSADIDWVITCLEKAQSIHHCHQILASYLVGGFSIQNQKKGLRERWDIYVKHFGLFSTVLAHLFIGIRYIWKNKIFNKKY